MITVSIAPFYELSIAIPSLATTAGTTLSLANLAGMASGLVPLAGLGLAGAALGIGALGLESRRANSNPYYGQSG